MKKARLYSFSFLCLSVFVLSQSTPFMQWWSDYRIYQLHIPFTRARYGDLYSGCFLSQYIDTAATKKLTEYKTSRKNIDLYILHDSYLAYQLKKENFIGVDKLILSDFRGDGKQIRLDRSKKNILIIESSERSSDWHFTDTAFMFSKIYINKPKIEKDKSAKTKGNPFINYFFNPFVNQNLEFNLFDYELFKPLKETKAKLIFNYFNKVPKDIAVSSNRNYLLLNETVDNNFVESSFRWLSNEQIDFIVNTMNRINLYYKNIGFDEVYFSIIPNPVSIIDSERLPYNHKIERIKNTDWLHAKFIDVYDVFKNSKKQIYRRDDSHWNGNGVQLWVNEVNTKFLAY